MFISLRPWKNDQGALIDPVSPNAANLIDADESRKWGVLPWEVIGNRVWVAYSDVAFKEDVCKRLSSWEVIFTEALPEEIEYAQDRVYGLPKNMADIRLGGILLQQGKIEADDLLFALDQQPNFGGKLGAILSSDNRANYWEIAEGVARQRMLPVISLVEQAQLTAKHPSTQNVWTQLEDSFWIRHQCVPIAVYGNVLTIAMVDPDDAGAIEELKAKTGLELSITITGFRDITAVYAAYYQDIHSAKSREGLKNVLPEWSAHKRFSKVQWVMMMTTIFLVVLCLLLWFLPTLLTINIGVQIFYIMNSIVRLNWILRSTKMPLEVAVTDTDLASVDRTSLPIYTILVPLYKETAVLPTIKRALLRLDYPKDRLDVKILLEEDDTETIAIARSSQLPNYVDLVIVPSSEPKTKPKACNYGLLRARGDYVVIFDAEDIPEPDQLLKAIATFQSVPDNVACVQAKLSYFNGSQNMLTRWFTAEYAMWFDLLLPALYASDLPIPLGGTSNHFRTDVLRKIGAWDPFNVTEDADLGIRLHRDGWRTAVMNSTTHEEANSEFVNWVRQRSRWVKGYLQTWFVHMRHPVHLWKELGPKGFFGFQIVVGGTPLTFLLNPLLWALTTSWFAVGSPIAHDLFPGWLYYTSFVNLLLGNFAFTYSNVSGMARRGAWGLVKYAALSPIYWTFMSVAAWKGTWQLITRPSYWEKTTHGLDTSYAENFTKGVGM
ncbi:glycosyltransferase [Alicyclobacillus fastidiosus]|uniref:Glycosyltransferase n=1 Tax=Alicyclobacillus fastidiosus TaxID=392011 RepID=A0ABV5AF80_9BACL|nr:glycosyltransferase [Alicyclobacillus fastidiosus]WEH09689.1 glycosyltransferase [Alicyclobacillus fastidiosus]